MRDYYIFNKPFFFFKRSRSFVAEYCASSALFDNVKVIKFGLGNLKKCWVEVASLKNLSELDSGSHSGSHPGSRPRSRLQDLFNSQIQSVGTSLLKCTSTQNSVVFKR